MTTQISILDTGKYFVGGTVASGEKRAIGSDGLAGSALNLKGVEVNATFGVMVSADGVPAKKKSDTSTECFEYGEADSNGVELPNWVVSGIFNKSTEEDMKTLGRLVYFTKTKGYKELYAPLDTTRTDLISYSKYGEREADSESTKTVNYVNVRVKDLSIKQSANEKLLKWTLTLVETN